MAIKRSVGKPFRQELKLRQGEAVITAENMGRFGWAWMMLHEQGEARIGEKLTVWVIYPVIG